MLGKTCKGDAESLEKKTSSHGRALDEQKRMLLKFLKSLLYWDAEFLSTKGKYDSL